MRRQSLHGGLWRKRLRLIFKAKKFSETFLYAGVRALLLLTRCVNLKKNKLAEKSYEVLNFFLHGALWAKRVKLIFQARKKLKDFI